MPILLGHYLSNQLGGLVLVHHDPETCAFGKRNLIYLNVDTSTYI